MAILALLNSNLMRFYYKKLSQVENTTKPQIYLNILKSLPILPISKLEPLSKLGEKILLITRAEDFLQNVGKREEVDEYERQIDQLVYRLYGLTPEEIEIVEGKT